MSGSQLLLLGGVPAAAIPVDPYFYSVTSLLHGDGTNGGQNNTFLDSSSNNFTITRNGNTTQGSFSPFSQTGWGNYFDGSTDSLTATNNAAYDFGSGAFTIEAWAYPTTASQLAFAARGQTTGFEGWILSTTNFLATTNGSSWDITITFTNALTANAWNHVAIVRNGNVYTAYLNGVANGTTTVSGTIVSGTAELVIGRRQGQTDYSGYISNFRIVKGTAVYTAAFTPSTTPLTAITNTSLLTCQSNRFLDASTNAFAITANGNVNVQPFSPFNPTTAYSASSIGGSGYFDGSGDYVALPNSSISLGSGDCAVEFWCYITGEPTTNPFLFDNYGNGSARLYAYYDANTMYLSADGTTRSTTFNYNSWNLFQFTRTSGTGGWYLNGSLISTTFSTSGTIDLQRMTIGAAEESGSINTSQWTQGYISNFRASTTNRSTSVPTTPFTSDANTKVLLNFTNGAIFDNAAVADYETVGNAQISTSVKKYGTGSMSFDGTGDWLITDAPSTQLQAFGTGDFTIEMWVYVNSVAPTFQHIYDGRPATTDGAYPCIRLSSATLQYIVSGSVQITGPSLSVNTWYHLAVSRVASQTKMFVNGTQVGSTYADTTSYLNPASRPVIGGWGYNLSGGYEFNGYIDDLRISKGVGRYPYSFTPPTAALPDIGGTVTLTADPYYEYTTLLLPGNGTNGAQNNTFLDSSTNAFTITRNGNTTQGTFSPFSQTGWSNNFDGSGDYLTFTGSSALTATGDFTFECWIYVRSIALSGASNPRILTSPNGLTLVLVASTNNLRVDNDGTGTSPISTANNSIIFNQWMHVAVVRSGSTLTAYLNGTAAGSATHTSTFTGTGSIGIGYTSAGPGGYFDGYISNMRMVVGTAVYTANFTPPTAALTAITNTQLLTCQSNRFVDNSSNAFAITRNGDVSVQAFSPFNPTASWSAATYGGSGYFDGSGDYLSVPSDNAFDVGSGNFTMEAWIYPTSYGADYGIIIARYTSGGASNQSFFLSLETNGTVRAGINGTYTLQTTATAPLNTWTHVAFTRSSNDFTIWLNGVSSATLNQSVTVNNPSIATTVGAFGLLSSNYLTGYMSGLRVVKGTAVYTAAFTPPTAPLTAISGTSLLTNFTNAGIYDATSKNDLETVGNAQISTAQSKFGGSSMYFDGTGDYLVAPSRATTALEGDFTVEFWLYRTAGNNFFFTLGDSFSSTGFDLYIGNSGNNLRLFSNNGVVIDVAISSILLPATTWTHVAIVRYSGSVKLYASGVQAGSAWSSTTAFSGAVYVGAEFYNGSVTGTCNGYIDDLRVTKGIARYTSNFTPPTTAFLTL